MSSARGGCTHKFAFQLPPLGDDALVELLLAPTARHAASLAVAFYHRLMCEYKSEGLVAKGPIRAEGDDHSDQIER